MPNGKDYILFYLKLLCESVDHEGNLRFSERIPYSCEMLATITNTNIDIVSKAVEIFTELGMMEILDDGTLFMSEVTKMIGSAANNDNAIRQANYRERQKQISVTKSNASVTALVTDSNESKSKNKSKSKNNIPNGIVEAIVDSYNGICVSMPRVERITDARREKVKARLKSFSEDKIKLAFIKAEESDFLTGRDGKWNGANFDWLMKNDSNMTKVLEGHYVNRSKNKYDDAKRRLNDMFGGE